MDARKAKPGAGRRRASSVHRNRIEYGKPSKNFRVPHDFRERIASNVDFAAYFSAHVAKLGRPNSDGWAECCCPIHQDENPSASANLQHGGFRCHGCGAKHDVIGFHQVVTGLPFAVAVRDLLGLGVRS